MFSNVIDSDGKGQLQLIQNIIPVLKSIFSKVKAASTFSRQLFALRKQCNLEI